MQQPELFEVDLGARKVHIIKIHGESAQGRHKHTTKEGQLIHKTQAGKAGTKWSIPDNIATDSLSTGLWKMRKNPYYTGEGGEAKTIPNSVWVERKINEKKYISWQEFFEISHYKTPGYYSSERISWNRIAADRAYKNTTLQSFRFSLIDGTNIIDLTKPRHQLMYFFALQCEQAFLKNKQEAKKYPRALFYIQEINAPEEDEYVNNKSQDDAIVNLRSLEKKFSSEIVKQMGVILKVGTMGQSFESMYNSIRNFIMQGTMSGSVKTNCEVFNTVYDTLASKGGRARFDTMFMLQQLLDYRIILEESLTYVWNSKRGTDMEVLGKSKEQVISLLLDPDQAHVRQLLNDELESKRF